MEKAATRSGGNNAAAGSAVTGDAAADAATAADLPAQQSRMAANVDGAAGALGD